MLKLSNEEIKTKIKEYKKIQKTQSGQAKKFNNQNKEREILRKKKEAKANRKIVQRQKNEALEAQKRDNVQQAKLDKVAEISDDTDDEEDMFQEEEID